MSYQYDLWDRFGQAKFWWMDLMIGVWVLFAVALFSNRTARGIVGYTPAYRSANPPHALTDAVAASRAANALGGCRICGGCRQSRPLMLITGTSA
jgi:hypothetical protein